MGDYLQHDWRYKSPDKTFIERALGFLSLHIKRLIIFSDEPEKARKFVFYNCMASRPDLASTTKGASIEVQSETLNLTIRPNADGVVKAETSETTTTGVVEGWYNAVYQTSASL
jgi:hypothetical protein